MENRHQHDWKGNGWINKLLILFTLISLKRCTAETVTALESKAIDANKPGATIMMNEKSD
jgi:hypothetical protein